MYNATQLRHLVKESARGLARRKISGSVAVIIMGSALLTLALFSLVTINLDRFIQSMRGEIDMTVFLVDDVHPEDRARLEGDLLATKGIRSVRYVSAQEALERFRVELGEDAQLLDALHQSPLPPSFEIQLDPEQNSAERVEDLARNLQQYPYVDDVLSDSAWVQRMERAGRVFVVVDLVVGLLVLLSALFVISNTVRLTIEESSQQVEIMKLVGATNWFIRTPYILSGHGRSLVFRPIRSRTRGWRLLLRGEPDARFRRPLDRPGRSRQHGGPAPSPHALSHARSRRNTP
jgi:cell division transport system permease protein